MSFPLPRFYNYDQMCALACLPDRYTRKGRRDRALIGVACATGLRASELCGLTVADVSPTLVFVRNGKGGHQRYVPLSSRAFRAVQLYLEYHPARPDEPVFRTLAGDPLTRRLVHKIVSGYSLKLRLGQGVHVLRSSAATRWLNAGVSLRHVQVALGHEHIKTTAIYVKVATNELVREFHDHLEQQRPGGDQR